MKTCRRVLSKTLSTMILFCLELNFPCLLHWTENCCEAESKKKKTKKLFNKYL